MQGCPLNIVNFILREMPRADEFLILVVNHLLSSRRPTFYGPKAELVIANRGLP